MDFNPELFDASAAFMTWVKTFSVIFGIGLLLSFIVSLLRYGKQGPLKLMQELGTSLYEFATPSPRHVLALMTLTMKEVLRNKVLFVFGIFVLLFMFAGWFIDASHGRADLEVSVNVTFALKVITFLVVLVFMLLSCWSLPGDIKDRSLHTVVTKPVTSYEIVLGRFLGFLTMATIVLAIMGGIGYSWIVRQTPDSVEDQYLICRVPHFGKLSFIDRQGKTTNKGINVGDMWQYRSYIQGGTPARAIWVFDDVSQGDLINGKLRLESRFEVFRTYKGDANRGIRFVYTLVNDKGTPAKNDDLRVKLPYVRTEEYSVLIEEIPQKIEYYDIKNKKYATADLLKDLAPDNKLRIEVSCLDRSQNIGMGQSDLFIRKPNKSFAFGYLKAIFSIWLTLAIVIGMGVSASTFVKGPVAIVSVLSIVTVGYVSYEHLVTKIIDWKRGVLRGGGLFEASYRIVTHAGDGKNIDDEALVPFLRFIDKAGFYLLEAISKIIPNFEKFDSVRWISKGFDVPWESSLFHALGITIAFVVPCMFFGFICLKYRELESK